MQKRTVRFLDEPSPGPVWTSRCASLLPAYGTWFRREGLRARPSYVECERALQSHMPELVPLWRLLTELAGGGDETARLLSLWRPTPFLVGCSQVAWPGFEPVLLRNYDYAPWLWEGDFWRTSWLGTPVLAASDCLWGALDGVNAHGLAVSLSFGGVRDVGEGFGMPLILRYVLETCTNVEDGAAVLGRVPSHMAYNVTLLDAAGACQTVQVRPGVTARSLPGERVAVNHQADAPWPEYARLTGSHARERALRDLLAGAQLTHAQVAERFLAEPLWQGRYSQGYGTLYTACWEPRRGAVTLYWPGTRMRQTIAAFSPLERVIPFVDAPGGWPVPLGG